ncbi:MAG: coniferyl aldehyde dehydrogenase [Parvularculaceae bacterium]
MTLQTPVSPRTALPSASDNEIVRLFALQKSASLDNPPPEYRTRIDCIDRIIHALEKHEARIVETVSADFGNRARVETVVSEILVTIAAARHAKRHLNRWMRPRKVATPLHMAPGKSRLSPQPLGAIGIISPWNYPVQLALSPAIAALAAGNRILLKPSELTPGASELLKEIVAEFFDEAIFAVVTGGPEVGQAFAATPFDHLLFTGSTAVGQKVAEAAAKNLTPVTLELGGKSPAVIDKSADLEKAARSIAFGKLFNAGQTCVAPDYVLAPRTKLDATVDAVAAAARKLYPEIDTTTDYSSIVSDRHFDRLKALIAEARDSGARIVEIGSSNALHPRRKLPLTLVIEPPRSAGLMREEIFGPILPMLGYDSEEEAIEFVNERDRPLALYWFGNDDAARKSMLERTVSGGVTVNDTMMHVAQENLPFGGVGKSGVGVYHGEAGFETFSHMKPVFYQSRFASSGALLPPYSAKTDKLLSIVKKLV